jgi:hypothetical protein
MGVTLLPINMLGSCTPWAEEPFSWRTGVKGEAMREVIWNSRVVEAFLFQGIQNGLSMLEGDPLKAGE